MKARLTVEGKIVRFARHGVVLSLGLLACSAMLAQEPAANNTPAAPANAPATAPAISYSDPGGIGVGVIVGDPTGVTAKGWLDEHSAIAGGFGWSFGHRDSPHIYADYLYHLMDLIEVDSGKLPLYFGAGGRVLFERDRDNRAGIRFPVGLAYLCEGKPIEIFGEIVPVLDLSPTTKTDLTGGVGIRYYFR
jgi:hypothetical protein